MVWCEVVGCERNARNCFARINSKDKKALCGQRGLFLLSSVAHVAPKSPLVIQEVLSRKQLLYAGKVWIKMRETEMKRSDFEVGQCCWRWPKWWGGRRWLSYASFWTSANMKWTLEYADYKAVIPHYITSRCVAHHLCNLSFCFY